MELKHIKLLTVASVINALLGAFLICSGLLEFSGIISTKADTMYHAIGVQLSYLVFISGMFTFASGGLTVLARKDMSNINFQIFIGVISLAWPIFVSISLFFAENVICIRLLPTMFASLFYMIAILIVKITNDALRKSHKFNPSTHIANLGKRKQNVNVTKVFNNPNQRKHSTVHQRKISVLFAKIRPKKHSLSGNKLLYSGTRRKHHGKAGGFLYSGARRKSKLKIKK